MTFKYQNVVVAGGSISGMMAALTLSRAGCNVTILERLTREKFQDQGAGLGLRKEVMDFLDSYTTVPMVKFTGGDSVVLDKNGEIEGTVPWPPGMYSTSWSSLATVLRQSLKTEVLFDSPITSISKQDDGLLVKYSSEGTSKEIKTDLVIGADGANSTVRKLMGLNPDRKYAGYALYRGTADIKGLNPKTSALFEGNKALFHVNDEGQTSSIIYRVAADKIMWGIYRPHTEAEVKNALLDADGHQHFVSLGKGMRPEILQGIKDWAKTYYSKEEAECVAPSETAMVQAITDLRCPQNTFMDGKVLLIGEASQLPRPQVAAGTVHSLYHAMRLKDLAEGKISIEEWSRNTKAYSDVLADAGLEVGDMYMTMKGNLKVILETRACLGGMMKRLKEVEDSLRLSE